MITIQELHKHAGQSVTGQFYLSSSKERFKSDGRPFYVLQLDDATGAIKGMVWPHALKLGAIPADGSPVELQLRPRWFNGELIADVQRIRLLDPDGVVLGAQLLPRRHCPEAALPALRDLVEFQKSLEHPVLKAFLSGVLLDPAIGIDLLSCKASKRHHHAFEGGLLVHCVSPMALVKTMAEDLFADDQDAIELTQVAYLLHDLGKLKTLKEGFRPAGVAQLRHEFFTAKLLKPHLDGLAGRWPQGASALSYIFDYIEQPREKRRRSSFVGADVVIWVDQHNAAMTAGRGLDNVSESVEVVKQPAEHRHAIR